jgi:hypothetical protein
MSATRVCYAARTCSTLDRRCSRCDRVLPSRTVSWRPAGCAAAANDEAQRRLPSPQNAGTGNASTAHETGRDRYMYALLCFASRRIWLGISEVDRGWYFGTYISPPQTAAELLLHAQNPYALLQPSILHAYCCACFQIDRYDGRRQRHIQFDSSRRIAMVSMSLRISWGWWSVPYTGGTGLIRQ